MAFFLPTNQIVDERVVEQFSRNISKRAEQQGVDPFVFPVIGDVSLGQILDELTSHSSLQWYDFAINTTNFSLPLKTEIVPLESVDSRVIHSYRSWINDIAKYRVSKKIHSAVLEKIYFEDPERSSMWKLADTLSKHRHELTATELKTLNNVEHILDHNLYTFFHKQIKQTLLNQELLQVASQYIVPQTDSSFSEVFAGEISRPLYEKLVSLHSAYSFSN